ncbi:MAG: isocitrate/isopropylmalate dehydrogenase family protein [Bdellovibrionales bacterium]|nr:isocitrate/isopropylmalate dehydrogenase family protein [Bdellovibrionales bacterium]
MESKKIVLLEGDGIGPEISEAVRYILEAAGARIEWLPCVAGENAVREFGVPLPQETLTAIRECGVALKGPIATAVGLENGQVKGFRSVNVQLRQELDLFANVRPLRSIPEIKTRYENVDLVVIRENTEGLYSGLELEVTPGVVTSLKVATKKACTRIAEFAFAYAEKHGRRRVTGVHKANIMKLSDGLALECYRAVANQHPAIQYDERIIDAMAMALVLDPTPFDVLVMENLYGDILSDLGAGLIGGLGLAPSANIGFTAAVFEAVHGSAPDIAGKGIANPTALLLSAVEMLRHLSLEEPAQRITSALTRTIAVESARTKDLGGSASTMQFAQEVVKRLDE